MTFTTQPAPGYVKAADLHDRQTGAETVKGSRRPSPGHRFGVAPVAVVRQTVEVRMNDGLDDVLGPLVVPVK